ncbi:Phospholipid hydroperoxide glutathione peroxidase [Mactra antiquata]
MTKKNYDQLAKLHDKYAESNGLRILLFPCNQFGGQEPNDNATIKQFMLSYSKGFEMFSKINVNGSDAHPLFNYLKAKQKGTFGDFIKWNFSKFLINKEGIPVKRYAPNVDPDTVEKDFKNYW